MKNTESNILDATGKVIDVGDRVHYATKSGINIGRVLDLIPGVGVKLIGKGKKRETIIRHSETQIIVVVKKYYLERIKSQYNIKA